jgi:hypothetical protein
LHQWCRQKAGQQKCYRFFHSLESVNTEYA